VALIILLIGSGLVLGYM